MSRPCLLLAPAAVRLARSMTGLFLAITVFAQDQPVRFGTTVVVPGGLSGVIYHVPRYTKKLPDFRRMKPVGTIYTSSLNIPPQDFRDGFPGVTKRFEWFAIDYTGRFWIEKPGMYNFVLTADDGAILYLDGRELIDNDGQHAPSDVAGSVELSKGVHAIRVSYFQGPRWQVALVLKVAGPGERLRIFNTDEFKPVSADELAK